MTSPPLAPSSRSVLLLVLTGGLAFVPCVAFPSEPPATRKPCCAPPLSATPFTNKSLYQVDTTWTTDTGQALKLGALRGRPRVVAMFFASCEYACPIIVHDLKRLEAALPAELRERAAFVLVSFDSARDTPAALRAYRQRMELDEQRWTLLRGEPDDVLELAALLGVKYKRDARGQFAHSNLITVLNAEGEIVHQLTGLNQDVAETARIMERLLKETKAAAGLKEPAAARQRPGVRQSSAAVARYSPKRPGTGALQNLAENGRLLRMGNPPSQLRPPAGWRSLLNQPPS